MYRCCTEKLGSTNLTVSIIGLGNLAVRRGMGNRTIQNPDVAAIVNKAEELGVNFYRHSGNVTAHINPKSLSATQ